MSSYDSTTGWTKALASWIRRCGRVVDGEPLRIDERLAAHDIDYYWDAWDGLHARCTPGELWQLVSGRPDTSPQPTVPTEPAVEWISLTDLGMVFEPRVTTQTVLKHVRDLGLLERRNGKDHPTAAADGLFTERAAEHSSSFGTRPTTSAVQRLWSYEVVELLRRLAPEANAAATIAEKLASQPKAFPAMNIVVRFPTTCSRCAARLAIGDSVEWDPQTKATLCRPCIDTGAPDGDPTAVVSP